MKLFFDANVLFTAAYSATGIARAFFDLEETGLLHPLYLELCTGRGAA